MVEPASFNLDSELARILEDNVVSSTTTFLEVNTPFQIRVTTAQQLCNMNDHKDVALVFDMRSASAFDTCHVDKSVNFSIERFKEDNFIEWTSKVKALETDSSIFKNKYEIARFQKRRRHWAFIICAISSENLDSLVLQMGKLGSKEDLATLIASLQDDQQKQDFLSMRNAMLLYKALKKEKLREIDLCICGFDKIVKNYPHHCVNQVGRHLIPRPRIAESYPNEIFPGRLFLGDYHHASDAHVIETLGITHIVNISDSCQNYLAESHPYLKYLHLCLHDNKEQRLLQFFQEIFTFIKEATVPDLHDCRLHTEDEAANVSPSGLSEDSQSPADVTEVPQSNQTLVVNLKNRETLVQTGKQQMEFLRIQKLFRKINKDNPDFKTKCLVHCAMGMSRSATSVLMFIMRLFSMKLVDAFEYVKTQRQATDPNEGFLEQLRIFEKTVFAFEQELDEEPQSESTSSSHRFKRHHSCTVGLAKHSHNHVHTPNVQSGCSDHGDLVQDENQSPPMSPISEKILGKQDSQRQTIEQFKLDLNEILHSEPLTANVESSAQEVSTREIITSTPVFGTNMRAQASFQAPLPMFNLQSKKVHNFSCPGALPTEVLQQAQNEMLNWGGSGLSVMEMQYNSKEFQYISKNARDTLRQMLSIPDNYEILFTQGGNEMQLSAVCMNLTGKNKGANFLVTGAHSKKAAAEAAKHCQVHIVENFEDLGFYSTRENTWNVAPQADFFYYVDNETRNGFELNEFPFEKVPASQPIVADMSSSFLTKQIEWSKYGVIYGSAGVASTSIVVVRSDLIGKHLPQTPRLLAWESYKSAMGNFPNTPNTWGIYVCGLYLNWQMTQGGIAEMLARSLARSTLIYNYIDGQNGYYICRVAPKYRSRTNITVRVCDSAELEAKFVTEASHAGLIGLKGHDGVGGVRINLGNGQSFAAVYALIDYMEGFKSCNPK